MATTAAIEHVLKTIPRGQAKKAYEAIDKYCWETRALMNVGDGKGPFLDEALQRAVDGAKKLGKPFLGLELGTFIGYSSLRMASQLADSPKARLVTLDVDPSVIKLAQKLHDHAETSSLVTIVEGPISEAKTIEKLKELGFTKGSLDFLFLDHWKEQYLPDFKTIEQLEWLRPGAIVVADNIIFPGAPEYREYLQKHTGYRSEEKWDKLEYSKTQEDMMLVSEKL
eukprot:Sspe_Gene.64564::Locus_38260_Transcript_1_1_Confidence_1.000_Length_922::g.64564::m.64564/K00545/COMT; catechol O-methyltransferase